MDRDNIICLRVVLPLIPLFVLASCSPPDRSAVDLYPEDECANCRMAISDPRFAAEIISGEGETFKFDDIGCMESYQKKHPEVEAAAMYVKDFETTAWLAFHDATIIRTGLSTPMGSGKLAFSSKDASDRFLKKERDDGQ